MAPMLELLQGENVAAVRGALGRLGCWTDQGQNGGRVSLSSLKHTLGQLNLVTVLTSKDAHEPGSFRCNCSAFVRDAQCVHEGFCRILEKDPKIPLHTLKHFTAKRLPDIYPDTPASESGGSHAGGRPLNLRGSAWSTVSQLQAKAAKATAKKSASASLDTPKKGCKGSSSRAEQTVQNEERASRLQELEKRLTGRVVSECWGALRALESMDLSMAEIKQHSFGKLINALSKDSSLSLLLRQHAQRLMAAWAGYCCVLAGTVLVTSFIRAPNSVRYGVVVRTNPELCYYIVSAGSL